MLHYHPAPLMLTLSLCLVGCSAQQLADLNRELDAYRDEQAADEKARLEVEDRARLERERTCARRPSGRYAVGLLSVSAEPRKPDGTTWDADLRGTEKLIGVAASSGVRYLGAQASATMALPPAAVDWLAKKAEAYFTSYAKEMFSRLVAPDLFVTATMDGNSANAVVSDHVRDNFRLEFSGSRPFGFAVDMNCDSSPGQHRLVVDVVDRDLMFDDPMFRITVDPFQVVMASGDGRRGAILSMRGDSSIGLAGYVIAAIPIGAVDVPLIEQ